MKRKDLVPTSREIADEVDRLVHQGLAGVGYSEGDLERCAELTWKINRLKREKDIVVPAHVYQRAEILHGVADFIGDSYKLAKDCAETRAKGIIFCGVRFMAETAKILNPGKEVYLPALEAGCSLADSITAEEVRALKAKHPNFPVVSYINTTAEVKAESDVIVTSANATKILKKIYETHPRLIFLPDEWMGRNLAAELGKKIGQEMVIWQGKCVVHENFDPSTVVHYRKAYPGVRVLAHAECSPALVKTVDFVGGTGDMMRFVKESKAKQFMLVTECGLGDLARTQFPEKEFLPMCRLCPYMKATDLQRILHVLEAPSPEHLIEVDPRIAFQAKRSIEKMFALAEDKAVL